MAHPGRARVNAISTALPDSQLRLGGRGGKEGWRGREGGSKRERELEGEVERGRGEDRRLCVL